MKTASLAAVAAGACLFAQTYRPAGHIQIGYNPGYVAAASYFSLNGATAYHAFSFVAHADGSLDEFMFYVSSVSGATKADVVCDLYSDSGGYPGVLVEHTVLGSGALTTGWSKCGPWATPLSNGTRYWLVNKNGNGSPATNTYQMRVGGAGNFVNWAGKDTWKRATTADGSTWTFDNPNGGFRVYQGGIYQGFPIEVAPSDNSNLRCYGANESGGKFTVSGVTLKVAGIAVYLSKTGDPGELTLRLRSGDTLVAETQAIPSGQVPTSSGWQTAMFASVQTVSAGTLRVSVRASGGNASNYYWPKTTALENSAASRALAPFSGTLQGFLYNGTAFDDTTYAVHMPAFALILDGGQPFVAAAGTAGGGAWAWQ